MTDQASEERYRKRWTRSVPALEAELAAIDALYQAEAQAGLSPSPESEAERVQAEANWQMAKKAYERAVAADKKEQRMSRMPAAIGPALQRIAKLRDQMIELLDGLATSVSAWQHAETRGDAIRRFARVASLCEEAAKLLEDPRDGK